VPLPVPLPEHTSPYPASAPRPSLKHARHTLSVCLPGKRARSALIDGNKAEAPNVSWKDMIILYEVISNFDRHCVFFVGAVRVVYINGTGPVRREDAET